MTDATKRRTRSIWNPFRPFHAHWQAVEGARAGTVVAGLIAGGYAFQALITLALPGGLGMSIFLLLIAGLAAALGWRIWAKQSVWLVCLLGLWYLVELFARVYSVVVLGQFTAVAGLGVSAVCGVLAILSFRGSLWLRRNGARIPVEAFD